MDKKEMLVRSKLAALQKRKGKDKGKKAAVPFPPPAK